MGIYAVYNDVKTIVQAADPTVEFLITAEAIDFQGTPPKVVWELPIPGGEKIDRKQLGPGYGPQSTIGRALWSRTPTSILHVWMPATGVDSEGCEYLDDNEDPTAGPVWLVQRLIQAIHQVCAGQYMLGNGGFGSRTMANLGFLYVLPVDLQLGVFGTNDVLVTATPTTTQITPAYTG